MRGGDVAIALIGGLVVPIGLMVALVRWVPHRHPEYMLYVGGIEAGALVALCILAVRHRRPGFMIGLIIGGSLSILFASICGTLLVSFSGGGL